MSSMPVAENLYPSRRGWFYRPPAGGHRHFRCRCAGILMTAPAVAAQLASEWQLTPAEMAIFFSAELGAMSWRHCRHGGG